MNVWRDKLVRGLEFFFVKTAPALRRGGTRLVRTGAEVPAVECAGGRFGADPRSSMPWPETPSPALPLLFHEGIPASLRRSIAGREFTQVSLDTFGDPPSSIDLSPEHVSVDVLLFNDAVDGSPSTVRADPLF